MASHAPLLTTHGRHPAGGGQDAKAAHGLLRGSVAEEHDYCRHIMEGGEGEITY